MMAVMGCSDADEWGFALIRRRILRMVLQLKGFSSARLLIPEAIRNYYTDESNRKRSLPPNESHTATIL